MARGYLDNKYRGGSSTKRRERDNPKVSKTQTSRKVHDTKKTKQ